MMPEAGCLAIKQSTFDWWQLDKYQKLQIFKTEVKHIFMANSYNAQENDKVLIILNWLRREGLQSMQTMNGNEQST